MVDGLQPYPEYRESGEIWLGKIPAHWQTLPNRATFVEINERGQEGEQLLSVTIARGVMRQSDLLASSTKKDSSNTNKSNYKLVCEGDIAYNKMRAWQGALGVSKYRGIVSPAYIVMRLRSAHNPRYFHYLLRTPRFAREAERWSYGITSDQWSLRANDFKQIYCAIPPQDEQDAIAHVLDHADRRIRRYIRAKRKLIALLNEQKQVIIQQVVTRGLDPDVPLKPSGVEWLGDIPAHWNVAALSYRYSVQLGKMLDAKRIIGDHLVPYLRNTDVQWDRIALNDLPQMDIEPKEYERYTLQSGDMLVCEGGDVGRSAFYNGELPLCGFQKALHRVRPFSEQQDCARFLYYLMYTASKLGVFAADGSENTIAHLTNEKLKRHRFPFPPIQEQQPISAFLDLVTVQIEAGVERILESIQRAEEYHTRLIADVVTGKLDVREAARHLPDEFDAPDDDLLDDEVNEYEDAEEGDSDAD